MSEPYFTKWLPVPGEASKAFDFTHPERGAFNIIGIPESHIGLSNTVKKVKLFLCSRDIKIGDIYLTAPDYSKERICEDDSYNFSNCLKKIGEISSEALFYVNEGMEFGESEIQRCIWTIEDFYTEERDMVPVQTDKWFNQYYNKEKDEWELMPFERKVIQIKGPCGHFH